MSADVLALPRADWGETAAIITPDGTRPNHKNADLGGFGRIWADQITKTRIWADQITKTLIWADQITKTLNLVRIWNPAGRVPGEGVGGGVIYLLLFINNNK